MNDEQEVRPVSPSPSRVVVLHSSPVKFPFPCRVPPYWPLPDRLRSRSGLSFSVQDGGLVPSPRSRTPHTTHFGTSSTTTSSGVITLFVSYWCNKILLPECVRDVECDLTDGTRHRRRRRHPWYDSSSCGSDYWKPSSHFDVCPESRLSGRTPRLGPIATTVSLFLHPTCPVTTHYPFLFVQTPSTVTPLP